MLKLVLTVTEAATSASTYWLCSDSYGPLYWNLIHTQLIKTYNEASDLKTPPKTDRCFVHFINDGFPNFAEICWAFCPWFQCTCCISQLMKLTLIRQILIALQLYDHCLHFMNYGFNSVLTVKLVLSSLILLKFCL